MEQVVREVLFWLGRGWPIPDGRVVSVLAELGWGWDAARPRFAGTGHGVNDPDAVLVSQVGFLYYLHYKVSDLVRVPGDVDRAVLFGVFAGVVEGVAAVVGTGRLSVDGLTVWWTSRVNALVEVQLAENSVVVAVLSPAAEFDRRVSAARAAAVGS